MRVVLYDASTGQELEIMPGGTILPFDFSPSEARMGFDPPLPDWCDKSQWFLNDPARKPDPYDEYRAMGDCWKGKSEH